MNKAERLPVFERGLGRLKLAVKSTVANRGSSVTAIPAERFTWDDAYLNEEQAQIQRIHSLASLGYQRSPSSQASVEQITAVSAVQGLFTPVCVQALQTICTNLESHAGNSDWIISRRTRGVTALSPFISDMMTSRRFLLAMSRIAGVPLLPYPMLTPRSQVNYFYPAREHEEQAQLGMWHTDGTNFVLNILLTAQDDYTGGQFLYHDGPVDTFNRDAPQADLVREAGLPQPGDALYIYGSRLFHGVMPVRTGRRMSLVLSFHCPYSIKDSNRFWHLASDDGIPLTVKNWGRLQRALNQSVAEQYAQLGLEPITFEELHGNVQS